MIPRTEIEAIEVNATIEQLRSRFVETGYSKILVYQDSIENILGYISSKELFKNPGKIEGRIMSVITVPETMPANRLLRSFMQEHKSMAVVVDEFGGTAGIITIEDILEEIIGEIEDEHDVDEYIEKQINDKEFVFSGRLEIDFLNEKYKLGLPESEEYETIAGLILYHYENIPKINERIVINLHFTFRILKVTNTRIELVYLTIHND
jgi:CBS domain containing-hemolysin-like protein